MSDLANFDVANFDVQVLPNCDLVVTRPETGDRVVYRKDADSPVLVAADPMRDDPDLARARFLASAWKAAHAKALQLGWLKS